MRKNYFLAFILTLCISSFSFGQDVIITGVFDGPNTGGTPKGVELYILNDIADLSIYGIGSANNGGGTDGEEFTFPSDAVTAGTYIYVATEVPQFTTFFGFAPNYTNGSMAINGDDAVELFKNGAVIDTFGDINKDGTGEPWDHLDGWAYRKDGTGPDGGFVLANWTFSGTNKLEGGTTNATTTTPFPKGTYTPATASLGKNTIEGFSTYPNPVNNGRLTIKSSNSDEKEISIFNVIGKRVFTQKFSGKIKQLDVSNMSSGIYIMKVLEGDKIATKKLVIK